jgi:hypothetical protein
MILEPLTYPKARIPRRTYGLDPANAQHTASHNLTQAMYGCLRPSHNTRPDHDRRTLATAIDQTSSSSHSSLSLPNLQNSFEAALLHISCIHGYIQSNLSYRRRTKPNMTNVASSFLKLDHPDSTTTEMLEIRQRQYARRSLARSRPR